MNVRIAFPSQGGSVGLKARGAPRRAEPPLSPTTVEPPTPKSQVQNAAISWGVIPPSERAGWTGRNVSQVCEIEPHLCASRLGGIGPRGARRADAGAGPAGDLAVGLRLHRRVQSPRCLEPREVERVRGLVWRLRRRSHEGGKALGKAIRAHSVVRGGDAPNPAGPDTEVAVTPGADAHGAAFPSQNRAVCTPGLSISIFGASDCRVCPPQPGPTPSASASPSTALASGWSGRASPHDGRGTSSCSRQNRTPLLSPMLRKRRLCSSRIFRGRRTPPPRSVVE
jgi:hypothetical protein